MRTFLQSKIHRATVTEADVDYVGSISIDEDLMDAAGLREFEQVHVAGLTKGARLITYVIKAPRGSGTITLNGAAALVVDVGELVIIFSYVQLADHEIEGHRPRIVLVDENNRVDRIISGEQHGTS
jgi:aspartate 1-decarboxylase